MCQGQFFQLPLLMSFVASQNNSLLYTLPSFFLWKDWLWYPYWGSNAHYFYFKTKLFQVTGHPLHMCCFGIGVTRTMHALAELLSPSTKALRLPASIAPFDVVVTVHRVRLWSVWSTINCQLFLIISYINCSIWHVIHLLTLFCRRSARNTKVCWWTIE